MLLALVACAGFASAARIGEAQTPTQKKALMTTDVVYGHKDGLVPIDQGETMYAALMKAGVPASFIRIKGAEHGFGGADPADLERANAAMLQWFEQHLGSKAK